jgi:hypothetical protein
MGPSQMRSTKAFRATFAAVALAATALAAAPASAAVTITQVSTTNLPIPVDQFMIEDFDNPIAAGFTFIQNNGAYVRSGALGLDPGMSAPPPGDTTAYETVLGGGKATLTSTSFLSAFSFYLGSPDTYNTVRFSGANGFSLTLNGAAILGGSLPPADGNQSVGRRVNYDFGTERVNKVEFLSSGNSFEFDSLAGKAAVPEPASWAMMITGFGAMGAMLRRRRLAMVRIRA